MRQRGFALLIVLWSMALLALLLTQVTATGRSETQLADNLRRAIVRRTRRMAPCTKRSFI